MALIHGKAGAVHIGQLESDAYRIADITNWKVSVDWATEQDSTVLVSTELNAITKEMVIRAQRLLNEQVEWERQACVVRRAMKMKGQI